MRSSALLPVVLVVLLVPTAAAQLPHPSDLVTHWPFTIESKLREYEAVNPDYAEVYSIGKSIVGFDIWTIDIHHPDADLETTYDLYLDANHHGNEDLGMESLLIFIEEVMDWSTTAEGAERLMDVRIVATPMVNTDGTGNDKRTNTNNVDLNRNYDYNWGLYGTDADPIGLNYRGPSPASEPETKANVALMESVRPDVYYSMHTGSHDLVLPWRQEPEADGPMPDWGLYQVLLAELEEVSGLTYRDPSGAGESISWTYGTMGTVSIVVEVSTTQFERIFLEDLGEMLKEEVAIFWHGVDNIESIGGHLVAGGPHVVNVGWGNATNVTFLSDAGEVLLVVDSVAAGGEITIPAAAVEATYLPRAQGDVAPTVRTVAVDAMAFDDSGDSEAAPLGAFVAMGSVGLALLLRRRR